MDDLSLKTDFISTKNASEISGYSADYLSRLAREKKIRGMQIGRAWLVDRASLAAFITAQTNRNKEIARELARAREVEYRARLAGTPTRIVPNTNSNQSTASKSFSRIDSRAVATEGTLIRAFTDAMRTVEVTTLRGPVPAIAVAIIALSLGALGAQAATSTHALMDAQQGIALAATGAREIMHDRISDAASSIAQASDEAALAVARVDAAGSARAIAPALATADALPQTIASFNRGAATASADEGAEDDALVQPAALPRAANANALAPTTARIALNALRHPLGVIASLPQEAFNAYVGVGDGMIALSNESFAVYGNAVSDAGAALFAHETVAEAGMQNAPRAFVGGEVAFGNALIGAVNSSLNAYDAGISAYVRAAPKAPALAFAGVLETGITTQNLALSAMGSIPRVYDGTAYAFVNGTQSVLAGTLAVEDSLGRGLQGATSGTLTTELALEESAGNAIGTAFAGVPRMQEQATLDGLAIAGKASVAANGLKAATFSRGSAAVALSDSPTIAAAQRTALAVYDFFHGATENISFILAHSAHTILVAFNRSFGSGTRPAASSPAGGAVAISSSSQPLSAQSTTQTAPASSLAQNIVDTGAVTKNYVTNNYYSTTTQPLALVPGDSFYTSLMNDIVDRAVQVVNRGRGSGTTAQTTTSTSVSGAGLAVTNGTFDSGAITNSTASLTSLTLASLNGPLQANSGVVSATSSIGVLYGGTGKTAAPGYGQLLLGNAAGGYDLVATSSLGIVGGGANLTATYPLAISSSTISLAFGTTTANSWSALQQFDGGLTASAVGIGTTTSTVPLAISYSNDSFGRGITITNTNGGTQAISGFTVTDQNSNDKGTFDYLASNYQNAALANSVIVGTIDNTKLGFIGGTGSGSPDIYFQSGANSTPALYINGGSQNVGVGTTSPFTKFSVAGSGYFSGGLTTGNLTATGTVAFANLGSGLVSSANGTLSAVATSSLGLPTFADLASSTANAYPFPLAGNATSTLTQFNGGASTTQLTVTGNTFLASLTATGTIAAKALTLTNALAISSGGTGTSTAPSYGQILLGNAAGGYDLVATSSLGLQAAGSYESPLTFTYPLTRSTNTISLAFGTTTSNTWGGTQTFTNPLVVNGTGTSTFSTGASFGTVAISNLTSALVKSVGGVLSNATAGVDYLASTSLSALYPLAYNAATGVFSTAFSTTTSNTFSALNTFNGGVVATNATTTNFGISGIHNALLSTNANGTVIATTSLNTGLLNGVLGITHGGTGSTTLTGLLKGNGTGAIVSAIAGTDYQAPITTGNLTAGTGLSVSGGTGAVIGSGAAISLGSSVVTGVTNDTNVTGSISSNNLTLGWTGTLAVSRGGTGASSLSNLIALGTDTTGNYLATLADAGGLTVGNSGSENAAATVALNLGHANSWTALQQFNGNASSTQFTSTGAAYLATAGGNVGVGTTTPGATFAVNGSGLFNGSVNLANLTATGTVAANSLTLGTPLAQSSGGTGIGSYSAGSILYADGSGNLAVLPVGGSGTVLKVTAGLPAWGVDLTTGSSGGGDGVFGTTTSGVIYPLDTSNPLVVGSNATSTENSIFEVAGQEYVSTKLAVATTAPATTLSVGGSGYFTGGLGVGVLNTTSGTLKTSGDAIVGGALNVSGATTLATSLNGVLHATAGVVSAGAVNLASDISGVLGIANGGTGTSTAPSYGQLLLGNAAGGYDLVATSTLGLQAAGSYESPLTFTYPLTRSTNTISLAFGTTTSNSWSALQQFNGNASTTQLTSTGSAYLATAGGNVGIGTTSPSALFAVGGNSFLGGSLTATGTIKFTGISSGLVQSSSGTLSSIATSSLGLLTTNVAEGTNQYFTNARAIAATLTGYTSGAGTISSSDSILSAIQKLNGNIGALVTGVSSASNSDGSLTVSPTSGAVVASLNTAHANSFSALQTFANASSTAFSSIYASSTNAFLGSLSVGSLNGLLKATNGAVSTASAGTDYLAPSSLTATYPLQYSANNFSLAFGTSTSNTWGGTQTFTNTIAGSINGNASTVTTNANLTGAITSVGNATSLGSFSSANLATALTDETGSGAAVFANSPSFTTPVLGAASATSLSLTNALTVPNGGTGSTTLTGILKGNGTGAIASAVAGTDYQAPLSFTYPLQNTSGTVALAFGTTTANSWSQLQTFNGGVNIATNKTYELGGQTFAYASSTNQDTILGLGAGGNAATTSASTNSIVAIGYNALAANSSSGQYNTGVGAWALNVNTSGSYNSAFGYDALVGNVSGQGNSAFGFNALQQSTSDMNTAVGFSALQAGNGTSNTALGAYSGDYSVGAYNTLLGYKAAYSGAGSYNIAIGQSVDVPNVSGNQQLNIGNLIYGTGVYNGGSDSSTPTGGSIGIGTTTPGATFAVNGSGLFNGNVNLANITATGTATVGTISVTGTGTSTFAGNIGITGNIVPSADNTYSLGLPTQEWKDVYIGPGSLYVNGQEVVHTDVGDDVIVSADSTENLQIKTSGGGALQLNPGSSGNVQLMGPLSVTAGKSITTTDSSALSVPVGVAAGNLTLASNSLSATNLNGGISLTPSGTGGVYVTSGDLGVGTTSPSNKFEVNGNSYLGGNATVTGNATISGTTTLGALSGVLQASSGVVSAVATSSLGLQSPITLTTTGTSGAATFSSNTLNIPQYTGTTYSAGTGLSLTGTIFSNSGVVTASAGNTGIGVSLSDHNLAISNNGLLSLQQTYGSAQTGALTFATSSAATSNGITIGQSITNSTGTFTFTPTISVSNIPIAALAADTISGVSLGNTLANLTATDSTLTFSGAYNGSTARTVGLDLANANTWTALQNFVNASSTQFTSTGTTYLATAGGNVGIGTTSPSATLSVQGSGLFSGNISAAGLTATGTVAFTGLGSGLVSSASGTLSAVATSSLGLQSPITLTTTGTSGAATFSSNTLNIPQYTGTVYTGSTGISVTGSIIQNTGVTSASAGTGIGVSGSTGAITFSNNGLLSLQQTYGSAQTGALTFATTSASYNGLTLGLSITNSTGTFTFAPTLSGVLGIAAGGTGTTTAPSYGQVLVGDASGNYELVATSSLGISGGGGTTYSAGTGLTLTGSTFSVNTSQSISTLSNLTSNGLVKTSGGTGALSIATAGTDYEAPISGTTGQFPYFSASNTLTATSSVFIAPNGDVGIGTSSPDSNGCSGEVFCVSSYKSGNEYGGIGFESGGVEGIADADGTNGVVEFGSLSNSPVNFLTNSNTALSIDTSGNVSIGETGYGDPLTVVTNRTGDSFLYLQNNNSSDEEKIGFGGDVNEWHVGGGNSGDTNSNDFFVDENGTVRFLISSAGNVGIGTTTPRSLFSIGNTNGINFSTATSTFSSTGGINLAAGCFAVKGVCVGTPYSAGTGLTLTGSTFSVNTSQSISTLSNLTSNGLVKTSGGTGALSIATAGTDYEAPISGTTGQFPYFSASNTLTATSSIFLAANGGVGIGTTTPTHLLQLAFTGSGLGGIGLDAIGNVNSVVDFMKNGQNQWALYSRGSLDGSFNIYNYGTSANVFTIASTTNNIGIGTTTPGYPLAISSSGNSQLLLNSTGDYSLIYFANADNGSYGQNYIGAVGNNLKFGISGAAAMTLDSGGDLGIGAAPHSGAGLLQVASGAVFGSGYAGADSAPSDGLLVEGNVGIGIYPGTALDVNGDITDESVVSCNGGTTALATDSSGKLYCETGITSDQRLKKDITPLSSATGLAAIEQLQPVSFNYRNPSPYDTSLQYGFLAQQVQQIFPNLVSTTTPTALTPNGTLVLNYYGLIAPAIVAIQQLDARTSFIGSASSTAQTFTVDASGNVGIKTAPVAGAALAVGGNANVSGSVTASGFTSSQSVFANALSSAGFATTTVPSSVLTAASSSVDLLALAAYNLGSVTSLENRFDSISTRLDTLESEVAALQAAQASASSTGSVSSAPSGPIAIATSSIIDALHSVGIYIMDGIAQFQALAADRFIAATDSAGNSSAGHGVVLAGNTTALVQNAYVSSTSEIFVTFTATTTSQWYVSDKGQGSFRITFASPQDTDATFDYFVVETDGQTATTSYNGMTPAPENDEIDTGTSSSGTTASSTPNSAASTTPSGDPPMVRLIGSAAMNIIEGGAWQDPGATAANASGADISRSIVVTGSVDTNTPGTYTITYTATDANGLTASASRLVVVAGAPTVIDNSSGSSASSTPDTSPDTSSSISVDTSDTGANSAASSTPSGTDDSGSTGTTSVPIVPTPPAPAPTAPTASSTPVS